MATMGTVRMAFILAADEALDKAALGLTERRLCRRKFRSVLRSAIGEGCRDFAVKVGADEVTDDETDDRPILDFWKWLIESGKIQPFMKFLVEEFLPALFKLIVELISVLAVL